LKESEKGPVIVTRNGKAVAALLAVEDDDEIERLVLAHSPRLRAILDASRRQIVEGKGLSHESFWEGFPPQASRKKAKPASAGKKKGEGGPASPRRTFPSAGMEVPPR